MDSGLCAMNEPVWTWVPHRQQFHSDGYLAAMNQQPFNPFQTDEWQAGFICYLEAHVSAPVRKLIPAS